MTRWLAQQADDGAHVIPLARGGEHRVSNAQAAHFLCNATKGDRDWLPLDAT